MQSNVTVTTFATSHDLTVLATVKDELGITDSSKDAQLRLWIKQASSIAASYCNRVFARETVTETFRSKQWSSSEGLLLSRRPVTTLTSVTLDDALLDPTAYEFNAESGVLYQIDSAGYPFWSGIKTVVDYIGGYELLGELPYDIERAVLGIIRDFHSDAARPDPNLIEKEIVGVSRYRWWASGDPKKTMPAAISGMLDPYVIHAV